MKSIRFKESNFNITNTELKSKKTRPQIPVRREVNGQVISCWSAPLLQRIAFLFHGKIWIGLQVNGKKIPPLWAACIPTVFNRGAKVTHNKK